MINTFVFPWGEATITLEDMKLCLGCFRPLSFCTFLGRLECVVIELLDLRNNIRFVVGFVFL